MYKLNYKQLEHIKKRMKFYCFEELNAIDNKRIIVKFHDFFDTKTYSDLRFDSSYEEFDFELSILTKFLKNMFDKIPEDNCIIIKYNEKWVVNKEKSKELYNIMKANIIDNNFNGGIVINKKDEIIEFFIESVFKYNSFIQFVFVNTNIIISPSDHMDIFFQAYNLAELEDDIVSNIKSLGEMVLISEYME